MGSRRPGTAVDGLRFVRRRRWPTKDLHDIRDDVFILVMYALYCRRVRLPVFVPAAHNNDDDRREWGRSAFDCRATKIGYLRSGR